MCTRTYWTPLKEEYNTVRKSLKNKHKNLLKKKQVNIFKTVPEFERVRKKLFSLILFNMYSLITNSNIFYVKYVFIARLRVTNRFYCNLFNDPINTARCILPTDNDSVPESIVQSYNTCIHTLYVYFFYN